MGIKLYCSRCKITDVPLVKYALVKGHQYYMCRPCNAQRHRNYRKTERAPKVIQNINARQKEKYPEKHFARQQVNNAIAGGRLHKSEICEECGKKGPTEGHHEDYAQPLKVIWLCKACHDKHK